MTSKSNTITRKEFITKSSIATAALTTFGPLAGSGKKMGNPIGANDRINVAVTGINSRGRSHIQAFSTMKNVRIKTLCDVDERLFADRLDRAEKNQGSRPGTETDVRRVLDDPEIDVLSDATPNHWHSLNTVWACQAGKDVYVEKPGSHNIWEGRKMVEAARKYNRIVQHGTQQRSNFAVKEAMQHLREGLIGEVYMARGLCFRMRGDIGNKPNIPVPDELHYDLWLGPAQYVPYSENHVHYNWHWQWEFGNGDIGNQGAHQMDVARWGLGVGLPTRVTSMGSMFLWDDAKTVPNAINTSYLFQKEGQRDKMLVFETRPWLTNGEHNTKIGVIFYGSDGYMVLNKGKYQTFLGQKEEPGPENESDDNHFANFIDAVRARDHHLLNADIYEGHLSASLSHIGLIATRLNKNLEFNPQTERFIGDDDANAAIYMKRNYRQPFVIPDEV